MRLCCLGNQTSAEGIRKLEDMVDTIRATLTQNSALPQMDGIAKVADGLKAKAEEKPGLTLVVVGAARGGKSTLIGKLAFQQDGKALKNPLPVDDGTSHVTIGLTKLMRDVLFSVAFKRLPKVTVGKLLAHFKSKSLSFATVVPEATLVLSALVGGEAIPTGFPGVTPALVAEARASTPDFPAGVAQADWTQAQQYAVIVACNKLVVMCLGDLAPFFEVVITAPWLPDVVLYDTPGLGEGRYDPLVKYALEKSDVIIPCNKGAPIPDSLFGVCLRLLTSKDLASKEEPILNTAPMFLILEAFGDNELAVFKIKNGLQAASLAAVRDAFREQRQIQHYAALVMDAVEERFASDYARHYRHDHREHLFKHFRETLLVEPDQPEGHDPLLTATLIAELTKRAHFLPRATYLDTLLNLVYQVRNSCRLLAVVSFA